MRELTTIGSLRTMRTIERSSRLVSLRGMGWMGATDPGYVAPTAAQIDAELPGDALSAATLAMLEHFQTAGVPSMHVSDPFVLAFQQAYNKDPASWAQAHKLGIDGGYGPNVRDAADALALATGAVGVALIVPPVNTGAAPVVPSTVIVTRPSKSTTTTTTTTTETGLSTGAKWLLGIAAALALGWGASRMMKKRRGRRRASRPSTAIVLAP